MPKLYRCSILPFLCRPVRRSTLSAGFAGVLLAAGSTVAFAQASSGLTGNITDANGAVIPGAEVTITNVDTKVSTKTVSTSAGAYAVTGLIPGRYRVIVTSPGFEKAIRDQVNVEISVTSTIDVQLQPGTADQTVEVQADLIAINTTSPELGTTIENKVVEGLPTEIGGGRGRQIDSFIFLAPGTQGSTFSHRINGGVDFQTETVFNGIPVPQAETQGYSTNFNPPFEMVNEFRVERAAFSAQFGLAQGSTTYQMASGTNAFHGDVFEFNRNNFFDAKGYFNDTVTVDRENNYGGTAGGPVWIPHLYNGRDRTFFHASIDWTKLLLGNRNFGTVPTAQEKQGNFSDFKDGKGNLIPIFDPLTGQQFAGNIIPTARFSAISSSLLQYIPNPDLPGLINNKLAVPNAYPTTDHVWGFTIDHNLTAKQSLHYSMWRNDFFSSGFDQAPIVPTTNPLESVRYFPTSGSVYLLNYVNSLTPKLVVTAGVGWVGEINNQFPLVPHNGANFAGVVENRIGDTFPNINFDGSNNPTSFGTGGGNSQSVNRKLGIDFVNNWLWTRGQHSLNIGGEIRRTYQDDNECQNCSGQFNFSQRSTADPANVGNTGSSFASFLLGRVDNARRIFANELSLRNLDVSPYIQDDWKITPKLTLNLGLRWDIMLPFTEKNNQIVYFNPNEANAAANGRLGAATKFGTCAACDGRNRADIHYGHFGPRVGFSYALNEKTVFQGGFNISILDGGAFEYGTNKVAVSYGNLLQGVFIRNSTNSVTPGYGVWDGNPLPAPAAPVLSSGTGTGGLIRAFDPVKDGMAPYVEQYTFSVQRALPWNTFATVAYVGNHDVHLNGQLNPINQPDPSILRYGKTLSALVGSPAANAAGITSPYPNFIADFGGGATVAQALQTYPQYAQIYNNFDLSGAATYNGLQATLEKRFSNGLSFLTSYTLSRLLSNVDSGFSTFASLPENKFNQYPEYTVDQSDIRNNTKISGLYELPIGPGKQFLNNHGVTGAIVGGWQIAGILTYQTGTPFGIGENDNPLGTPGGFNRPNRVAGVALKTNKTHFTGRTPSTTPYFTTNAFQSTAGTYVLGNAQRNYTELRGPGYYNEDLNLRKKFAIGERVSVQLQMDYFNALNRTIFNGPDNNISDGNYGFVSTGQSNTPRQGQVSGKIVF